MASNTVTITVDMDDKNVKKTVRAINGSLDEMEGSTRGATASVGDLVKAFLGLKAVEKVVTGVTDTFKKGFNFDATVETMETAWSTILGGADKATKMVQRLNKYAAVTPFDTENVDKMAKYLYNAGVEGEEMFTVMTKLGDVGAAYGLTTEATTENVRQFSQVLQSGVAFTEDLNMAQDKGIPIIKEIAKQQGISAGEVRKWASEGKISSEIFASAMYAIGDGVSGAMDAQSKTWSGMISTFEDNFDQLAGTLAKPIFDKAKEGLAGLLEAMDSEAFKKNVDEIAQALADLIDKGINKAIQAFNWLRDNWDEIVPIGKNVLAVILAFKTFTTVVGAISSLVTAFQGLSTIFGLIKSIPLLGGVIGALSGPIGWVVLAVTALVGAFVYLWNTSEGFRTAVINIWNAIVAFMKPIIDELVTWVMQIWGDLVFWWQQNSDNIMRALETAWNFIKTVTINTFNALKPFIEIIWGAIKQFLIDVWDVIKNVVEGGIKFIQGIIEVVTAIINGDWDGFWRGMHDIVQGIWQAMLGIVQGVLDTIKTVISTGLRWVAKVVTNILGAIESTFNVNLSAVKQFVIDVVRNIISWFNSLGDINLVAIGEDVIQGFMNGIENMVGSLFNMIGNLGNTVVDYFSKVFKIGSPSKVMRDEIGKWIPAGIAVGIEHDAFLVNDSIDSLTSNINMGRNIGNTGTSIARNARGVAIGTGGGTTVQSPNITINATWNNKEDVRTTMQEIDWANLINGRGAL